MNARDLCTRGALVVSLCCALGGVARGQTFKEGFESHGFGPLDKNDEFGPNAAPNGMGNPWFGPLPPNGRVTSEDNGVLPHTGDRMLRGANVSGSDFDQNWYNLQYRINCGQPLRGDIELEWWFYDPVGPGNSQFRDYVALAFYDLAPSDTDYPGSGSLINSTQIQRLSLGATTAISDPDFDSSKYQARIVGANDGYVPSGWFNLPVPRSIGWHRARIQVGPALPDDTNLVRFYIDDMDVPALQHNSVLSFGYNVIEINTKFGAESGYFDDLTFTAHDDGDGDSVLDTCDLCPNTPPDVPVDPSGCIRIPGDFNTDGLVNAADLDIFVACAGVLSAPAVPYDPQHLPITCPLFAEMDGRITPDLDRNGLVNMNDFGILQRCYNADTPADPHCAD